MGITRIVREPQPRTDIAQMRQSDEELGRHSSGNAPEFKLLPSRCVLTNFPKRAVERRFAKAE